MTHGQTNIKSTSTSHARRMRCVWNDNKRSAVLRSKHLQQTDVRINTSRSPSINNENMGLPSHMPLWTSHRQAGGLARHAQLWPYRPALLWIFPHQTHWALLWLMWTLLKILYITLVAQPQLSVPATDGESHVKALWLSPSLLVSRLV